MDVREKLVELLGEVQETGVNEIPAGFGCTRKYITNEIVAAHLISNGVTVQEWISVDDRLPEDDEQIESYYDGRMSCKTVLVYTKYGIIIPKNRLIVRPTGNKYLDDQVTDGWIWSGGTEEVTHWMPMPNPPKGE